MKKKKMNKLRIVICFILATACGQNKNNFIIQDDMPIILNGQMGEIRISLRQNSMLLEKIDIFNNEKSLLFSQTFDDQGMIIAKLKAEINDSISYMTYKSFLMDMEKQKVNDTLIKETFHSLITTRELKNKGDILYLDIYENGKKRYNALSMRLIDSEWLSENKVNFLLKNYFPYEGEFEFYYLNSREKLISKKIEKNYYLVEFQKEPGQVKSIKIDVEILPSKSDSLINSIFTQEIFLKY